METGKISWKGCDDGTPSSSTKHDPNDMPERSMPKGDDWKGMPDGTPSSKPASPES